MAENIAAIGIKIDTSSVDGAVKSLETLASKGASVDKALGEIERASAKTGKSLSNLGGKAGAQGLDSFTDAAKRAARGVDDVGNAATKAGGGLKAWASSLMGVGEASRQAAREQERMMGLIRQVQETGTQAERKYIQQLADKVNMMRMSAEEQGRYIAKSRGMSQATQELAASLRAKGAALEESKDKTKVFGDALGNMAKKIGAAAGAFMSISKVMGAASQWTDMSNRLKLITDSADGLARAQADVVRIAQSTRSPLEATAQLYQRIAQQQEALGMSTSRIAGVVETVSKAMTLSGVDAAAANAALVQFGQALASGVLRGDELNSILEQAPGLAQAMAAGLDTTTGKLREMGAQGQLTAEIIVGALEKQADAVSEQFDKMAPTMSQALSNLNTSFTVFIGKMDEFLGVSSAIASTIQWVAKNFDILAVALGSAAIVGAVAAFGGIGAAIAGLASAAATAGAVLVGALFTPIGLAVATVAGLTAAYIHFKDELEGTGAHAISLGDIFSQLGQDMMGALDGASESAKQASDANASAATDTMGFWEKAIRGIAGAADMLATMIVGTVAGVGRAMGNIASAMTEVFAKAFNWIAEKAEAFINTISRGVNSVSGLFGVGKIGPVSFGRATTTGARFDIANSFRDGYDAGATTRYSDMAGGLFDRITTNRADRAARAAQQEKEIEDKNRAAKATRELTEAEDRLEQQRIKALGVDKEYQQTLSDLQKLREAGRISEQDYISRVEELAKATWKASAAGKADADSRKSRAKAGNDAARAAESEAKAYQSFVASIEEKIAAQEQELATGKKLTQEEKARLQLEKEVAKGRISAAKAASQETEALLKRLGVAEKERKLRESQAEFEKERVKYLEAIEKESDALKVKNEDLREEIRTMGMSARQLIEYERTRLGSVIAKKEEQLATVSLYDAEGKLTEELRKQIAELRERQELLGNKINRQEEIDHIQQVEAEWNRTSDSIGNTLTDAIMRGFEGGKGFAKNFKDTLVNMFKTLVLRPVINFIVQPISNAIGGFVNNLMGGLLGTGQGAGGGVMGNASTLNSIMNLFGGTGGNMGAISGYLGGSMSFANAAGSIYANAASSMGLYGGNSLNALLATNGAYGTAGAGMGGLAAGAAVVAIPLIVGALVERNSRDRYSSAAYATSNWQNDPYVTAGGTQFNALTGQIPDHQALIDRAIELGVEQAVLDRFGTGHDRALSHYLNMWESYRNRGFEGALGVNIDDLLASGNRYAGGYYTGQGYASPQAMGWWNEKGYANYNADPQMTEAMRAVAISIVQPLNQIMQAAGLGEANFQATAGLATRGGGKGVWAGLNILSDGQSIVDWTDFDNFHSAQEAIRGIYSQAMTAFEGLDLPGWASNMVQQARGEIDKLSGENVGQEAAALYAQFANGISQMYVTLQRLIDTIPQFANVTQDSLYALQESMGGLDNMRGAYSSYINNFWTEEERHALMRRDVEAQITALGVSMPATRDAFRELVEAQDLNTEAGRAMFQALMGVADAFAAVTDASFSAFQGAQELTSVITEGLLGNLSAEDLGGQMADIVIGGVYNAIASGFADQITQLMMQGVINPVIQAALTGTSVAEAVSQAAIDSMVQQAQAVAAALGSILSDPAFQSAMSQIETTIRGMAPQIAAPQRYYTPYSVRQQESQRLQEQRQQAAQRAAEEAARQQEAILRERQGLLKQLLELEGNQNLLRQMELQELDPSNRALQQRIWALKDAAEAEAKHAAAMKEAQEFMGQFTRNIQEFVFRTRMGMTNTSAEGYTLAAAKFGAQMTLARGGDRDALNSITSYADTLINSIRRESATGAEANLRIARVLGQLSSLPQQLSAEQLIVNAVVDMKNTLSNVLVTQFDQLDTNLDGLLTVDELRASGLASNAQISALMARVDANGDQMISKQEAVRAATVGVTTAVGVNTDRTNYWGGVVNTTTGHVNTGVGLVRTGVDTVNASTVTGNSYLEYMESSLTAQNVNISTLSGIRHELAQVQQNLRSAIQGHHSVMVRASNGSFHTGGYTGDGGKYEVAGMVHKGEVVFSQEDVARWGGKDAVERLRLAAFASGGAFANNVIHRPTYFDLGLMGEAGPEAIMPLSRTADGKLGVTVNVPRSLSAGSPEQEALIAEVRALRAEVNALRADGRSRHSSVAVPIQNIDRRLAKFDLDGLPATRTKESTA